MTEPVHLPIFPKLPWSDTAVRNVELPLVLITAPCFLAPQSPLGFGVLAVPLFWLILVIGGGRPLPLTPLNATLCVLCFTIGLSTFVSPSLTSSQPKLAGTVWGILCFYALVRWIRQSAARWRMANWGYIASGTAFAAMALVGTRWLDKLPTLTKVTQNLPGLLRGIPGAEEGFHPNAVAGTLLLFIPVQVAMLAASLAKEQERNSQDRTFGLRPLQMAATLLTIGTLILTQSRGAWLGLLVGLLVFGFTSRGRLWRGIAGGLAALLVALLTLAPRHLVTGASRQIGSDLVVSAETRLELWSRAWEAIGDFPISGMGMNTFRQAMPVFYPTFSIPPDMDVAQAHNQLLQVTLDIGVVGLVAYLALWLGVAGVLVRLCRRSLNALNRMAARGYLSALIAYFAFGITDSIPLGAKVGIVFWIFLGLAIGLTSLEQDLDQSASYHE